MASRCELLDVKAPTVISSPSRILIRSSQPIAHRGRARSRTRLHTEQDRRATAQGGLGSAQAPVGHGNESGRAPCLQLCRQRGDASAKWASLAVNCKGYRNRAESEDGLRIYVPRDASCPLRSVRRGGHRTANAGSVGPDRRLDRPGHTARREAAPDRPPFGVRSASH